MFKTLKGKVIHGKNIGSKLGFPTANLEYSKDLINIEDGVYIATVELENSSIYPAVVNKGKHPTFPEGNPTIEAYILFQNLDIYNQDISINFIKKIRNEIAFNNKYELIDRINKDIELALNWFTNNID